MKKYRIIKKYWRDNDTAKIKHYYIVEYLSKYFGWKEYKVEISSICGDYKEAIEFSNEKDVREYVKDLKKSVPEDEIIK